MFLNDLEHKEVLNWVNTKPQILYKLGYNDFIYKFLDADFKLDIIKNILTKLELINNLFNNATLDKNECYYFNLKENGYFPLHKDSKIRPNILLQKSKKGGNIIANNKVINMEEKEMYILDATQPHEVTKIEGNKEYKSLIFSYNLILKDK
jgi:hypothetical protein